MFQRIKNAVVTRISPTTTHLGELRQDFRSRLNHFKQDRSTVNRQVLEYDFNHVLMAWGIATDADIPLVIRELRLRLLIFILPMLVCATVVAITQNVASCLIFAIIAAPCLLGLITTGWRIAILKNRRFTPLLRWLLSAVFFKKLP